MGNIFCCVTVPSGKNWVSLIKRWFGSKKDFFEIDNLIVDNFDAFASEQIGHGMLSREVHFTGE